MLARDVMTTSVMTIGPQTTVSTAIDIMLQKHVSGLPVVDAGKLVGILSEGDLLRRFEIGTEKQSTRWLSFLLGPGRNADDFVRAHGRFAEEIMTRDPIVVSEGTPLEEVVSLLEQHHIKRVPVVRDDMLVGIITRADLLRALRAADQKVPFAAPQSDQEIGDAILEALKSQPWAPNGGLKVLVENGNVTISGTILDDREREAIKVLIENVPNVKSVKDELVWIDPSGSGAYLGPDDSVR
jgi:CBS domain-containing protein